MKHSTVLAAAMAFGLAFHAHATDFYWIGGESSEWANGSNWSYENGGSAAEAYPNDGNAVAFFPSGASLTLNSIVKARKIFTDGTKLAGDCRFGTGDVAKGPSVPRVRNSDPTARLTASFSPTVSIPTQMVMHPGLNG